MLPLMTAALLLLNPLVGTAHLVMNAKQGVKNPQTDNRRSPEPDKNGNQFVTRPFTENKNIDREQYRKPCANKIVDRIHKRILFK